MKRLSCIIAIAAGFLPFCALAGEANVKHLDAAAAAKFVTEQQPVIVDVRTAEEFSGGHIHGAKNIDIYADDFAARIGELDKKKPVLVHCQSGGRSRLALDTFKKLGFESVYHLDGGMRDWKKSGQPVEK